MTVDGEEFTGKKSSKNQNAWNFSPRDKKKKKYM